MGVVLFTFGEGTPKEYPGGLGSQPMIISQPDQQFNDWVSGCWDCLGHRVPRNLQATHYYDAQRTMWCQESKWNQLLKRAISLAPIVPTLKDVRKMYVCNVSRMTDKDNKQNGVLFYVAHFSFVSLFKYSSVWISMATKRSLGYQIICVFLIDSRRHCPLTEPGFSRKAHFCSS